MTRTLNINGHTILFANNQVTVLGGTEGVVSVPLTKGTVIRSIISIIVLVGAIGAQLLLDITIHDPTSLGDFIALAMALISTLGTSFYVGKFRQIYDIVKDLLGNTSIEEDEEAGVSAIK